MKTALFSSFFVAIAIIGGLPVYSLPSTPAITVSIDGRKANTLPHAQPRGLGMVAANGSSRLLLDYKLEHPQQYQEILNYLFNPKTGIGLSHLKIEMGADINSSSGTEPCVMRTPIEKPDVTRGANYQLAADARAINPEITLDLLWWSEPRWVTDAADRNAARYAWYKGTLKAVWSTYGLKFDYVSANRNENKLDTDWIIYLSKALKAEKDCPYDFSKIKVVAADEITGWQIADRMLENAELRDAVDVIASHYTSWSTEAVRQLSTTYGKEVWFSEGAAPMSYSQGTCRFDGSGSGISDINGMLDIATRIITMYPGGGMNLYEFQPAVASYYDGSCYYPKQLITANEPWSGYYTLDPGYYMALHVTRFAKPGWQFIDGACAGDGIAGGDGHAIVNSTFNYLTLADPKTGDYSVVIANNTAKALAYNFTVANLKKQAASVDIWETRGPDGGRDYFANYFRKTGTVNPAAGSGGSRFSITVQPYSLVTISTLSLERPSFDAPSPPSPLALPYADDFEYQGYGRDYLSKRGQAPRYTTDEGGAFEVAEADGGHVLAQKVLPGIRAVPWGSDPDPVTTLGDDRWANYRVSADVLLGRNLAAAQGGPNYVGLGARYNLGSAEKSGYWIELKEDGTYCLNKNARILAAGESRLEGFAKDRWHTLQLTVNADLIEAWIDQKKVFSLVDSQALITSGRVGLFSNFAENSFDNLRVEAIPGRTATCVRIDDTDAPLRYEGAWKHETMSSFRNIKRTVSTGSAGAVLGFSCTGEGFAVLGAGSQGTRLKVEIDAKVVDAEYVTPLTTDRTASYGNYHLAAGFHAVRLTVLSGSYVVDAVEILGDGAGRALRD